MIREGVAISLTVAATTIISVLEISFITELGSEELTGASLAIALFNIVFIAGLGTIVAIVPLLSSAKAHGDTYSEALIKQAGFRMTTLISIVGLGILAVSYFLSKLYFDDEVVSQNFERYLLSIAGALPFWYVYVYLRSVLIAENRVHFATYVIISSVPLHAIFFYFLGFEMASSPSGSLVGIGAGFTCVSAATSVILYIISGVFPDGSWKRVRSGDWSSQRQIFLEIASLGIPMGARILLREALLPATVFLVTPLGVHNAAIHALLIRYVALGGIGTFGVANASIAAISRAISSNSGQETMIWKDAVKISLFMSVILAVTIWLFATMAFSYMRSLTEMNQKVAIILAIAFILIEAVQGPLNAALAAHRDTRFPLVIYFASCWMGGYFLAAAAAYGFSFGIAGVWCALCLGASACNILLYLRLRLLLRDAIAPLCRIG